MRKRWLTGLAATAATLTLALTGCVSAPGSAPTSGDTADSKGTITVGFLPSWTDGLSTAYLLENQLSKLGYSVELTELNDSAVLYAALSNGDIDIYASAWPVTQAYYVEKFRDDIEDLGHYYDDATITLVIPDYVTGIDSIADLAGKADLFDGEIIGIEPGTSLAKNVVEVTLPAYGLEEEYTLVTSSTAAMLATVQERTDRERPVIATFWRPYWANQAFPVKELADPLGKLGVPETMNFLATRGFTERYPEVAQYVGDITLSDEAFGSLEGLITGDKYKGDPRGAVAEWLPTHLDAYPGIIE